MRFFTILFIVILSSGVLHAGEVANNLLKKTSQKIEQKIELAANDLFDNIEIDLSGFHEGKPSYSVMSLLPLYDANNRNSFLQAHLSTQADVEMFNVGFVQRQTSFDNKIIVLTSGSLIERKGMDTAIKSFKSISDKCFIAMSF